MASIHNKLRGTGVAVVTPFRKDGSVDFPALSKVVEHIVKGKCEYIVALGTTGESVTLDKQEKESVFRHIVDVVNKRVPVVIGIGGNNTAELVHQMETGWLVGADAILSVSPYYNKPNQRGIYEHYRSLSQAAPLPIILYNVPGRTASNITAETTLKLAGDFKNIVATKEASGNLEQIMTIIRNRPKDFLVISGDDLLTLPTVASGGDGVISVVANAFPKDFSEMVRLALKNKMPEARKLHYKLLRITQLFFADGNPGGVKVALEAKKLCGATLRQPLWPVNDTLRAEIIAETKKIR
ncbi:MAG: dihydrodipicolinate synthase [Bacteroidetes bacterium]|nr:MAG: dihydrodipicolinate synthase [Bacteroidota bacterium]